MSDVENLARRGRENFLRHDPRIAAADHQRAGMLAFLGQFMKGRAFAPEIAAEEIFVSPNQVSRQSLVTISPLVHGRVSRTERKIRRAA